MTSCVSPSVAPFGRISSWFDFVVAEGMLGGPDWGGILPANRRVRLQLARRPGRCAPCGASRPFPLDVTDSLEWRAQACRVFGASANSATKIASGPERHPRH